MRFIKKRRTQPEYYDARSQKQRRIRSHRVKRCGICTFEFPEEDMTIEDGTERCPLCRDLYTAEWLAHEELHVARVKEESAHKLTDPAQYAIRTLLEPRAAAITSITDSAGNFLSQSNQLLMPRNAAKTVLLNGQYFSSLVTFTYPTGITDNAAPIITATLITLSLIAALGMTAGSYGFTLNDGISQNGHVYSNLFAVR